jgi:hypothetical protein
MIYFLASTRTQLVGDCYEQFSGADPGFLVRGGRTKKNCADRGRRENFGGISCEKSQF